MRRRRRESLNHNRTEIQGNYIMACPATSRLERLVTPDAEMSIPIGGWLNNRTGGWSRDSCAEAPDAGYQWLRLEGDVQAANAYFVVQPSHLRVLRPGTIFGAAHITWRDVKSTPWFKQLIVGSWSGSRLPTSRPGCRSSPGVCGACLDGFVQSSCNGCAGNVGGILATFQQVVHAGQLVHVGAIPAAMGIASRVMGDLSVSFVADGYCDYLAASSRSGTGRCAGMWDGALLGGNGARSTVTGRSTDDKKTCEVRRATQRVDGRAVLSLVSRGCHLDARRIDGPFLYRRVPASRDFVATVRVWQPSAVAGSAPGLLLSIDEAGEAGEAGEADEASSSAGVKAGASLGWVALRHLEARSIELSTAAAGRQQVIASRPVGSATSPGDPDEFPDSHAAQCAVWLRVERRGEVLRSSWRRSSDAAWQAIRRWAARRARRCRQRPPRPSGGVR